MGELEELPADMVQPVVPELGVHDLEGLEQQADGVPPVRTDRAQPPCQIRPQGPFRQGHRLEDREHVRPEGLVVAADIASGTSLHDPAP